MMLTFTKPSTGHRVAIDHKQIALVDRANEGGSIIMFPTGTAVLVCESPDQVLAAKADVERHELEARLVTAALAGQIAAGTGIAFAAKDATEHALVAEAALSTRRKYFPEIGAPAREPLTPEQQEAQRKAAEAAREAPRIAVPN